MIDEVVTVAMAPGDLLVLFTDGFYEWANEGGEQFGIERLRAVIFEPIVRFSKRVSPYVIACHTMGGIGLGELRVKVYRLFEHGSCLCDSFHRQAVQKLLTTKVIVISFEIISIFTCKLFFLILCQSDRKRINNALNDPIPPKEER